MDQDRAVMADSESSDLEDEQLPATSVKPVDQSTEVNIKQCNCLLSYTLSTHGTIVSVGAATCILSARALARFSPL